MRILEENSLVKTLFDTNCDQWKVSLLKEVYSEDEVEFIRIIPISLCNAPDKLTWRCIGDEKFSVKSVYHLLEDIQESRKSQSSCSSPTATFGLRFGRCRPLMQSVFSSRKHVKNLCLLS